jgi:predicted AAA+ superfamily ATPase
MVYLPRVVDNELNLRLSAAGAVVIEGPKACGKTETARQVARSSVLLDVDTAAQQAVAVDPSLVLAGATPRLIDEWQIHPAIWNHVRRLVDDRSEPGQFILTGSSVPSDDLSRHTGAGRFSFLHMRPMSLFEGGQSSGAVSLAGLLAGEPQPSSESALTIPDLANLITIGGWPAQQGGSVDDGARFGRDYLAQIAHVDVGRVVGTWRDPTKVARLLSSLARNVATEVAVSVLATDAGGADEPLARNTVADYLSVLERLMIIENQPAWAPHMRSKAILRSSPKRHFVDPSLAVAAMSAGPERLLRDLNFLGFLFESLVVRDLRVFAQPLDGRVFHYRDNNGLEVDAIVQLADGRWGAFEIKLGPDLIEDGASSLRRFSELIDTAKSGEPAVLAVISGVGYAYTRDDGVVVVPIGALGP